MSCEILATSVWLHASPKWTNNNETINVGQIGISVSHKRDVGLKVHAHKVSFTFWI